VLHALLRAHILHIYRVYALGEGGDGLGLPVGRPLHGVFRSRLDAPLGLLSQLHELEDLHLLVVGLLLPLVAVLLELDGQTALVLVVEQVHQSPRKVQRSDAVLRHEEGPHVLLQFQIALNQREVFLIQLDVHLGNAFFGQDGVAELIEHVVLLPDYLQMPPKPRPGLLMVEDVPSPLEFLVDLLRSLGVASDSLYGELAGLDLEPWRYGWLWVCISGLPVVESVILDANHPDLADLLDAVHGHLRPFASLKAECPDDSGAVLREDHAFAGEVEPAEEGLGREGHMGVGDQIDLPYLGIHKEELHCQLLTVPHGHTLVVYNCQDVLKGPHSHELAVEGY
jgi:hypothetical protein